MMEFFRNIINTYWRREPEITEAYRQGRIDGFAEGQAEEQRLATLRLNELRIAKERERALAQESLIDPTPFLVTETEIKQFIDKLKEACNRTSTPYPTKEQMEIIVNKSKNVSISAGAGSGKSTTLFLRIYFMHHVMGIPLSEISVFSFTVSSTKEFRSGLISLYEKMGNNLSEDQARTTVRTFHSKILQFFRENGPQDSIIFEFIGRADNQSSDHKLESLEISPKLQEEKALGLASSNDKLNSMQTQILKEAYKYAYRESREFRRIVDRLYVNYLKGQYIGKTRYKNSKKVIESHAERDLALTHIAKLRYEEILHDFKVVDIRLSQEFCAFSVKGFRCKKTNALIFALLDSDEIDTLRQSKKGRKYLERYTEKHEVDGFTLAKSYKVKLKLISGYQNEECYIAENEGELLLIMDLIQSKKSKKEHNPSLFKFKLKGEFEEVPIYKLLFNCFSYLEIMGVEPTDVLSSTSFSTLPKQDQEICKALTYYAPSLVNYFQMNGIVRFGEMFRSFNEDNIDDNLALKTLMSMNHIIIDEFQDISPDVVKWIRGVLKRNRLNGKLSSLMVVGDDAQSIYSWKGSCPEFLSKYNNHFDSLNISNLYLKHNFRCPESVLRIAESALHSAKDIKRKIDTPCRVDDIEDPVEVHEDSNLELFFQKIEEEILKADDKTDFLVLSATRSTTGSGISDIKSECMKRQYVKSIKTGTGLRYVTSNGSPIEFHTYYTSKGLEADICFLYGDKGSPNTYPFRNAVVQSSMLLSSWTYDDMQENEARRLIYVALSRAKRKLIWVKGDDVDLSVYQQIHQVGWEHKVERKGLRLN